MRLRPLVFTWMGLMALLAATVGASFLPIGGWRQVVNLAIAAAKAGLILWIFMKLKTEAALVRLVAATAAVLLLVLAAMLAADYQLRPNPFKQGLVPSVSATTDHTVHW